LDHSVRLDRSLGTRLGLLVHAGGIHSRSPGDCDRGDLGSSRSRSKDSVASEAAYGASDHCRTGPGRSSRFHRPERPQLPGSGTSVVRCRRARTLVMSDDAAASLNATRVGACARRAASPGSKELARSTCSTPASHPAIAKSSFVPPRDVRAPHPAAGSVRLRTEAVPRERRPRGWRSVNP
jgi:hypothetical protein